MLTVLLGALIGVAASAAAAYLLYVAHLLTFHMRRAKTDIATLDTRVSALETKVAPLAADVSAAAGAASTAAAIVSKL